MSSNSPEIFTDHNYRQAIRDDIERGMDPEDLAEIGHSVYGETSTPVTGIAAETPEIAEVTHQPFTGPARREVQPTRRLFELPGVGKGRANFDQPVQPGHVQRGLSNEAIGDQNVVNSSGAAAGLDALSRIKPPKPY